MNIMSKRSKRILSIVLSLMMIFGGLTLSTSNVSAETYEDFTYTVNADTNTVTITGYSSEGPKEVVIPDTIGGKTVTSIGTYAFNNDQITSVTIPRSVTTICDGAFYNNKLTSVTIPEGVETIGNNAFSDNELKSVLFPSSVTTIGQAAFNNNELTSVTIPKGVEIIEATAFADNKLTSVTIPSSVTAIGPYAFSGNQLTSVMILSKEITIGSYAFNKQLKENKPTLERVVILVKGKTPIVSADSYNIFMDSTTDNFKMYGYAGSSAEDYAKFEGGLFLKTKYDFVALKELTVDAIADQGWTGAAVEPKLVVKDKDDANKTLTKGKDYTVTYKNNVNAGTATATITGIGDYEYATATKDFTIIKYPFTDGTGQTITSGDDKDLTFRIDGPLELLDKVYINDKELDASNYIAASGSTIITLKKSYVNTLTAGTYTLKATYINGVSASTDFVIKAKETTPTTPTDPGDATKSPQTGDTSDMGMWIMLLVLAAGTTTVAYRKRTDK